LKLVLFDSDVLLDVLAQRQPFVIASAQALNTVTQEQVQGYVSGHAVTNIFYILRRQVGSQAARELISIINHQNKVQAQTAPNNSSNISGTWDVEANKNLGIGKKNISNPLATTNRLSQTDSFSLLPVARSCCLDRRSF
jgi:predicted nucleic acid-binding protein